jgi:hypothetical protein
MSLTVSESRKQAMAAIEVVKTVFEYTMSYNDKRTSTTRRIKCVNVGAEYNAEHYNAKAAEIAAKLKEQKIEFFDCFFVENRPGSNWQGVALHLTVPVYFGN